MTPEPADTSMEIRNQPLATVPATPESMLQSAIEAKMDPAAMAGLYDLFRTMKADQAKAAFTVAFSAFKSECPPVMRRTENPQFKVSRNGVSSARMFASLEDIAATVTPVLGRHGLSFRWGDAVVKDNTLTLSCIVSHIGGHSESSSVTMPLESSAGCSQQQKYGIADTYAQRYSLVRALGLTTCDEDTDGNGGGDSGEPITAEQAANLEMAVENVGGDRAKFLKMLGADTFAAIPLSKYRQAVAAIAKKREAQK